MLNHKIISYIPKYKNIIRAIFKWLSKVITQLRLLRLVIGLKDSRQFFNQRESKPIAPCTCGFSRALSELQVIARNYDWFIALPAPVVIGWSNCFGFGFSTVIWKPLYYEFVFWIIIICQLFNTLNTRSKSLLVSKCQAPFKAITSQLFKNDTQWHFEQSTDDCFTRSMTHWNFPRKIQPLKNCLLGGPASDWVAIWKCWFLGTREPLLSELSKELTTN